MNADQVTLIVPAKDEYARTVRMTAVSILSRAGISVDLLDDVRIAVEEAYIYACELGGREDRIGFEFAVTDGAFDARVGPLLAPPSEGEGGEASDRYARFILESVCDEFEACDEDAGVFLRISKRLERD